MIRSSCWDTSGVDLTVEYGDSTCTDCLFFCIWEYIGVDDGDSEIFWSVESVVMTNRAVGGVCWSAKRFNKRCPSIGFIVISSFCGWSSVVWSSVMFGFGTTGALRFCFVPFVLSVNDSWLWWWSEGWDKVFCWSLSVGLT